MRTSNAPMTRAEFEQALTDAARGLMVSDRGADERLNVALTEIFTSGLTPEREAEARAAFARL